MLLHSDLLTSLITWMLGAPADKCPNGPQIREAEKNKILNVKNGTRLIDGGTKAHVKVGGIIKRKHCHARNNTFAKLIVVSDHSIDVIMSKPFKEEHPLGEWCEMVMSSQHVVNLRWFGVMVCLGCVFGENVVFFLLNLPPGRVVYILKLMMEVQCGRCLSVSSCISTKNKRTSCTKTARIFGALFLLLWLCYQLVVLTHFTDIWYIYADIWFYFW